MFITKILFAPLPAIQFTFILVVKTLEKEIILSCCVGAGGGVAIKVKLSIPKPSSFPVSLASFHLIANCWPGIHGLANSKLFEITVLLAFRFPSNAAPAVETVVTGLRKFNPVSGIQLPFLIFVPPN